MSKIKKNLSLFLALILTLNICTNVFASNVTPVSTTTININGVQYKINETTDESGNKEVTVIGNGEKNTIINNGTTLHVRTEAMNKKSRNISNIKDYVIQIENSNNQTDNTRQRTPRAIESKYTLYWHYSYYYDTSMSSYGMYWSLSSGDDYGSYRGFDKNNTTARDYAYDFCTSVRELDSSQWAASAASGTSAGSIAAAIASAGPTAGVGAVIGVVAALLSGGVAVAEWVSAYNKSLDCNQIYSRFKQAL